MTYQKERRTTLISAALLRRRTVLSFLFNAVPLPSLKVQRRRPSQRHLRTVPIQRPHRHRPTTASQRVPKSRAKFVFRSASSFDVGSCCRGCSACLFDVGTTFALRWSSGRPISGPEAAVRTSNWAWSTTVTASSMTKSITNLFRVTY